MKVFFSAGEPSGDIHGANLIRALQRQCPDVRCVGFGGEKMRAAGCDVHFDLTTLAVMWLAGALRNLRTFFRLADQAEAYFRDEKPDAVVLIDYPGFNWHLAKRAGKYGIPVYYYSPPQVWAWKQARVKKLRENCTLVFSGLPFETDWLREHGCRVEYVGHPFFDEVEKMEDSSVFSDGSEISMSESAEKTRTNQVALLPGSRMKEVCKNVPVFLRVVRKIRSRRPETTFAFAAYNQAQADWIQRFLQAHGETAIPIHVGETPQVVRASRCCLSGSGSVSLELLYYEKPTVIVYQVPRYAWWLQWLFRRVRYITLVNLLVAKEPFCRFPAEYTPTSAAAGEVLFPEYLTCRDRSSWMAEDLLRWLNDDAEYERQLERLRALKSQVAQPGAADRAAEAIVRAYHDAATTTKDDSVPL